MIRFGRCMSQGGSLVTQIRTDELLSTCVCAQRDGGGYRYEQCEGGRSQ